MRHRAVLGILLVLTFLLAIPGVAADNVCTSQDVTLAQPMNAVPLVGRPSSLQSPVAAVLHSRASFHQLRELARPREQASFGSVLPSVESLAVLFHVFRI